MTLLTLTACAGEAAGGPGRLQMEWTGADTGKLEVRAHAIWCSRDSVIEISGAAGDSGVAVALLPADTLVPGMYPVFPPVQVRTRPGARLALRWPGQTAIQGFYGISGSVTVDSGPGIRGSLAGTLQGVQQSGQISVTGTFRNLQVQPGSRDACGMGADSTTEADG